MTKICVSIGRGRHRHIIAEHKHLVEQGAELVELRLDYMRSNINLNRLLEKRPCPVVVTCRRDRDGGKWKGTEEQRLMILRAAIAAGVEYVDLEEDIADQIPRYGSTKRIVSLHDFEETPEDLDEIHARLAAKDADIVKIAALAHSPMDSLRIMRMMRDANVPTIGIAMGDVGMASRILAGKFGTPFTFATFHHERSLAPGQLSFDEMKNRYNFQNIGPDTQVYGVIADPVGHSLSPVIHNRAFDHCNMNRVYVPFRVPSDYLNEFADTCSEIGVRGLSVTIPHKESVIRKLTKVEKGARSIGAVNTVVFEGSEVIGYNTDLTGAMGSLADSAGEDDNTNWLEGKDVLILGAGGAARAIGYGVVERKGRVHVASRTMERSVVVAAELKGTAVEWAHRHDVKADIVINATPVGMHPNVDHSPYEAGAMRRDLIVFDTVYNPEQTLLIKTARDRGCRTCSGVEMFVRQAALQFKLFTGEEAPSELMRETIRETIGAARRS